MKSGNFLCCDLELSKRLACWRCRRLGVTVAFISKNPYFTNPARGNRRGRAG
jgi:hypothetical protein